jgi:putative glycosyltransferase (TIGR04372 family)
VPKRWIVMLASSEIVANHAILDFWTRYALVIRNPIVVRILRNFITNKLTRMDVSRYCVAINATAGFPKVQANWGNKPPLLQFKSQDKNRGERALEELGIPKGRLFVCIHSRSGGYAPHDENLHNYRNSLMDDYLMAVDYFASQGVTCIAMGDSRMPPFPKNSNLIDYAHHSIQNEWLDLYLAANCKMFLGNSSGAFAMANVFGVPVACANMAPLSSVLPCGPNDIGIPKLYKEVATERLLNFKEIMNSQISNFRESIDFHNAGIKLIDSSPQDILDLAIEKFEIINNSKFKYSEEDEALQLRFKALFKPGHYCYGSASRIGRSFLKRYQYLLEPI